MCTVGVEEVQMATSEWVRGRISTISRTTVACFSAGVLLLAAVGSGGGSALGCVTWVCRAGGFELAAFFPPPELAMKAAQFDILALNTRHDSVHSLPRDSERGR